MYLPRKREARRFVGSTNTWSIGAIAGLAGGGIEIAWIATYMRLSGGGAAEVARGVTDTVLPNLVAPTAAVSLGIAIHMGLAIMLGIMVAVLVRSLLPRMSPALLEPLAVVAILVLVWAINFFVVLPIINPAFVALVPYTASLVSKVLFGAAAGLALKLFDGPETSGVQTQKGDQLCPTN